MFGHVTQGKNKIANEVLQLPVYESDSKKDVSIYTTFLIHICVKKWEIHNEKINSNLSLI